MKRFYLFAAAAIAATLSASADIPSGYYSGLNGKSGAELKRAAAAAASNVALSASTTQTYQNLPSSFRLTDVKPGTEYWWDMYSALNIDIYMTFGRYMNREHAFPKSWWGGSTSTTAYCDLFNLYPANAEANQAKLNYPLGEVSKATFDNGVTRVGNPVAGQGGGAVKVFEPDEEYKGDFARIYFYMATTYQNLDWAYTYMTDQNDYPTLKQWAIDLLLKWHREDPVSEKEYNRNEEVYKIQNNRNPFIDLNQLPEYLWGNKMGLSFSVEEGSVSGEPELNTPLQDMAVDFGQVAVNSSVKGQLKFDGTNLTGTLSLLITGADKAMFSVSSRSIAASLVNADGGYLLPITYTPTAEGTHTARLVISDGGLVGSRGIELRGECLPVPELSTLTATAATDVSAAGYTANWGAAPEVVDYYVVTRTIYAPNGTCASEDIPADENSLYIESFEEGTTESYHVRSCRLGYYSEPSNEIYVEPAGITGADATLPMGWVPDPMGVRILTNTEQKGLRVYDLTGRIVYTAPTVNDLDIVPLPLGVYFITTDQCRTPLRVIVRAW